MSIISKSAINWNEIDLLTQESIIKFYHDLWSNEVISFCSNRILKIKKMHQEACLLSRVGKAYITLKWNPCYGDDSSTVDIQGVPIDTILDEISKDDCGVFSAIPPNEQLIFFELTEKVLHSENIIVYSSHVTNRTTKNVIPSVIFYEQNGVGKSLFCQDFPLIGVYVCLDGSIATEIKERTEKRESKSQETQKATEQSREDSLYDWLRMQGVDVERQVKTSSNHTIDLWIPDKMMIELKRSSVSGNDICQCIEYASEYRLSIVLVGDKISGAASRGIKGFNKLCPKNKILFISWDAIHDFLKGRLFICE